MKKIGHSMKYLIVSGDSNTDHNFRSVSHPDKDFSYKKWPELLADKLGMKCTMWQGVDKVMNISIQLYEIVKIEDKSQIGLVIAAWSQAPRKDYKEGRNWTSVRINTHGNTILG